MTRPGALLLAVAGAAAVAVALARGPAAAAPKPPIAGRDPITGNHVALAQFSRKPVFVNFWG